MTLLAIDPGPVQSALVVWDGKTVLSKDLLANDAALRHIELLCQKTVGLVVCEKIASYGMPVGEDVFSTVYFSGRIWQLVVDCARPFHLLPRLKVKMHLCHKATAKDSNIRQALVDRFGPPSTTKIEPRFGRNGQPLKPAKVQVPGITHGLHDDLWAAFALAVTYHDTYIQPTP